MFQKFSYRKPKRVRKVPVCMYRVSNQSIYKKKKKNGAKHRLSGTHLPLPTYTSAFPPGHPPSHIPLTSPLAIDTVQIRRNDSRLHRIPIPPPIIAQLRLPRPKNPPHLLLIRHDLRCEPLAVERLLRTRIPGRSPLHIVGHAERKFADDGRPVAAAVVAARGADVRGLRGGDPTPFQVAVVVVGGEIVVCQVLCGVAGAPEVVHHLDVQVVVACDPEGGFGGTDALIWKLDYL